jgi:histidyl-tRNA synthetase
MSNQPIQTLKGFRDFLPKEKRARDFVASKIRATFERFGFEPLETPTLEYADLLLGKYGAEADKLVYTFEDKGGRKVGLRYDQTVPTARVLAQYQNELPRYFRRYQIQNVFRADKPQSGRYREFTQCDPDIFGSRSPIADAEIVAVTYFAFKNVGFPTVVLKLNDRQTLFSSLEPFATDTVPVLSIIQSIDKLDKMSETDVLTELQQKGLSPEAASQAMTAIKTAEPSENLQQIIDNTKDLGVPESSLTISSTLARGLDYYTGMIFEVIVPEYGSGSLAGGGRYDNLIKQLGGPDIPAVGIAFGFDRMVEAAQQLQLVPASSAAVKILVTVFDENTQKTSLQIASLLRSNDINTQVFPTIDKLPKQLAYASKTAIPFVAIIGPDEQQKQVVTLKNMKTGEQVTDTLEKVIPFLQSTN